MGYTRSPCSASTLMSLIGERPRRSEGIWGNDGSSALEKRATMAAQSQGVCGSANMGRLRRGTLNDGQAVNLAGALGTR